MRNSGLVIGTLSTLPAREHPELLAAPVVASRPSRSRPSSSRRSTLRWQTPQRSASGTRYHSSSPRTASSSGSAQRPPPRCCLRGPRHNPSGRQWRGSAASRRAKASFAPMELAVAETGMEYGGITPIGLPAGWPIYVDARVAAAGLVIVGGGVRRSKLVLPGGALGDLPDAEVVEDLAP